MQLKDMTAKLTAADVPMLIQVKSAVETGNKNGRRQGRPFSI
jgi:hypothetical protein